MDDDHGQGGGDDGVPDDDIIADGESDVGFSANLAIEHIQYANHVSDVYLFQRVVKLASKIGLGPSFQLT